MILGLLVAAAWLPARGEVVYARRDMHSSSVPELRLHLHGNHGFGPALWAPQVQLGRPAFQTGGMTQAFWPCLLASAVLRDEWELHSVLVLVSLVLGGLFAYGLFRELDLHPWSAAACALGFGFSSFHGHVGEQLFYVSGSVWSMGLYWAFAANLKRPSPRRGLLFALVLHSALLSAYPQQLVWAGWFGLFLLFALVPPRGQRRRVLLHLALWSGVGLASAAPFLLDLADRALAASRSVMIPAWPERDLREWLVELGELGDPLWNGRVPLQLDGLRFWGVSFTPFFGAAVLLAVAAVRTRLVLAAAVFVLATLVLSWSEPIHGFAARRLGVGLSSFHPFAAAHAAIFLLAAIGFDRAWREPGRVWRAGLALVLPVLAALGSLATDRPHAWFNVAVSCALALGAGLVLVRPWWAILALGAALSAGHYGVAGFQAQTRGWIERYLANYQPVADELRGAAAGGRLALVGTQAPPWPAPNTEILHDLVSIHGYDSLPAQRYKDWVRRVSAEGMVNRQRVFNLVASPALASEDFWRAGVRVVASYEPLDSPLLRESGVERGLRWFEVLDPAPMQAWVPLDACRTAPGAASIPAPLAPLAVPVERQTRRDEWLEFVLEPRDEPGLLWVSQQYHPRWRARTDEGALETVPVDVIWQGVLVPAGTERITLEYRPWIRWWWIPQLGFAAAGIVLGLRALRSRRERTGRAAGPGA
ncbi:MAG TPA: hypothetical protein VF530_21180 [Planctomycetota bacterium]